MGARAIAIVAAAAAVLAGGATSASAQARPARGFISINAGAQAPAAELRDSFDFEAHVETGSLTAEYPGRTGGLFDASAGVRVWRRLGIGAGFSRSSASGSARVSARVPHPLFDDSHRNVEGEAVGVGRTESAVHVQVFYHLPTQGSLQVRIFGGPSFVRAEQDVIHTIEVDEEYPFDTAEFAAAPTRRGEGSATGMHAGVDLSWMFARRLGVGALLRYTRASLTFDAGAARSVAADVGGVQGAAGLRIVF